MKSTLTARQANLLRIELAYANAEIARLKERLEWREDGWDGIACRDTTISYLEKDLKERDEDLARKDAALTQAREALVKLREYAKPSHYGRATDAIAAIDAAGASG